MWLSVKAGALNLRTPFFAYYRNFSRSEEKNILSLNEYSDKNNEKANYSYTKKINQTKQATKKPPPLHTLSILDL